MPVVFGRPARLMWVKRRSRGDHPSVDTVEHSTPLVDLVAGTRPGDRRGSTSNACPGWSAAIKMVVATGLTESGSERLDDRGSQQMLLGSRVAIHRNEVLSAWLAK
jgi:hypothetical protein